MALIFDTNALSAFADGDEKLLRVIENETELALPVMVPGEYLYGIRQSGLRASYEAWIKENLPTVRETAERYSAIRSELKAAGTPIPANHLWIAALARHRRMRLLTRDSHFCIRGIHTLAW